MFEINVSFNTVGLFGIPVFIAVSLYLSFLLGRAYERKTHQDDEAYDVH